jgi:hypothetical protein
MTATTIIWLAVGSIIATESGIPAGGWVSVYNKFQYWITRAQRNFADVDIIMHESLANSHTLV